MYFHYISSNSTTDAWIEAIRYLFGNGSQTFNLVIQIKDPVSISEEIKDNYEKICKDNNMLNIKQVSYTIFPDVLYKRYCRKKEDVLYEKYIDRFQLYKGKGTWGTYFHRMIYKSCIDARTGDVIVYNQLKEVISMLRRRRRVYKSRYLISIFNPIEDLRRTIGGPCLNFIALQLEKVENDEGIINLIAFYRNHNFLERAFGNYVGLGNLLAFICNETGYRIGYLTCISSHAYIGIDKRITNRKAITDLKEMISRLNN